METWVWLAAYVLGFGLVQVVLYRYFQREDPGPDTTPTMEGASHVAADAATATGEGSAVRCPHCGTENDPEGTYSYCRECVGPLA